ncbi:glycosyltransferase [Roseateles sp. UC29_93]|uniref:glycosyltransferase n=1 Tax=Roseateles sp. UC29_93 TaxID=3350177 RepID=UPI00366F8F05
MQLTASLVLYNNARSLFEKAIASYLAGTDDGVLHVVDNSPEPLQSTWFQHARLRYLHTGRNLGFGAGHNVAIRQLSDEGAHLLLNPDIEFDADVLPALLTVLEGSPRTSALMPRVLYPDGEPQHLCKLLPSPVDLFARRFLPSRALREQLSRGYELRDLPLDRQSVVPSLSGCMLMIRTRDLLAINGFDERYFMYMEDVDLVRRLGDRGETRFVPEVHVTHAYAKGSYRNRRLLGYHIASAIKYFNKWGWTLDRTRRDRNRAAKRQLSA